MPILHNNSPLFRIKFKDANIREVRRGNELEWGLYEINYVNGGPNTVDLGFNDASLNIPNYVWGYPDQKKEEFVFVIPDDATALESGSYRSHSSGWYDTNDFSSLYEKLEPNTHKDLNLFCKWTQRRYCFNGTYNWDIWVEDGGSGSVSTRDSWPAPDEEPYPWSGSASLAMPNCTWYAYYRAIQDGASAPTTRADGSSGWLNAGRAWLDHPGNDWEALWYDDNWGPGDILVYGDINDTSYSSGYHVAFIEGDGECSESVYTYGGPSFSLSRNNHTAAELYEQVRLNWDKSAYSMSGGSGGILRDRYWSKHSGGTRWGGVGAYLGRLHYTNWGSGSGHWEPSPWGPTFTEKYECGKGSFGDQSGTQDDPMAPSHLHTGSYRERERWDPFKMYTDERTIVYTYNSQTNTWDASWSPWRENVYTGEEIVLLGDMPSYNNGWQIDWD